jgi:hypothetical protein
MSGATALGGIFSARAGDLLRRAPGVPQLTNTVKQLLRWHKKI